MTQTGVLNSLDQMSQSSIQKFMTERLIGKVQTALCVKVVAVHDPDDELIDVTPLIYQQSASGDNVDHSIIYNVPVCRHQRGNSAILMRPKVGDIGLCVIATQDISILKKVKNFCKPGTMRKHDWGDAIYVMSIFNAPPTQYIEFADDAINLISLTKITINAPDIDIIGDINSTGSITNNGKKVDSTHTHPDPQGGNTSPPN